MTIAPFTLTAATGTPGPLLLDSPHSGRWLPAELPLAVPVADLADAEDTFVDELWAGAPALGAPLLAATFSRAYVDPNRHAADIDPELLDRPWPHPIVPSGKARIGKAVVWRTLDDGRTIHARQLTPDEVAHRIDTCLRPYQQALAALIDATHTRHGVSVHLNCHSMNPSAGVMGEGRAGVDRADVVLGDRDGTSCSPALTAQVGETFARLGYSVRINDPFKGVELVRAFSDPAAGRHSLQIELNKRLYMNPATGVRHAGFDTLRRDLGTVLAELARAVSGLANRHATPRSNG
jgi:N-formylglutamate deformylase